MLVKIWGAGHWNTEHLRLQPTSPQVDNKAGKASKHLHSVPGDRSWFLRCPALSGHLSQAQCLTSPGSHFRPPVTKNGDFSMTFSQCTAEISGESNSLQQQPWQQITTGTSKAGNRRTEVKRQSEGGLLTVEAGIGQKDFEKTLSPVSAVHWQLR